MTPEIYDILEEVKGFALGLNGETHVDKAIKKCPCDACRIVCWIINKQKEIGIKEKK